MMAMPWTAVAFWIFVEAVDISGTVSKGFVQVSLTSPITPTVVPTEDESIKLVNWLTKYGYLPPSDPSGQLQAWTAVTEAVKRMQKFAGLDDTGILDEKTLQVMETPRCSLPDDDDENDADQSNQLSDLYNDMQSQRMRRAVSTWTRKNINWRLRSYPGSSKLSREMIRSLVYYALRVWADPTLLEFHEVRGPEGPDLQIDFLRGPHGDGYPFDGTGGSVGHAFFPSDPDRAGGVHLDAEEEWAFRQPEGEGTDLFTVLVHELGHALGLTHSSARQSVMRPYYHGPLGDPLHFSLGHHDLHHVTALYGKRGNHIPTDRPLVVTGPQLRHRHGGIHRLTHMYRHTHTHLDSSVDRCNTTFDAVAKIRGEIFFFKGEHMWRVSRGGLVSVRAVNVHRLWSALPSPLPSLSAVLERNTDHAIIFITGSEVWLFKDLSLQEGFPQPLSAFAPEDSETKWQGLHWDSTQGVVWGSMRVIKENEDPEKSDGWSQLIDGGVNGIITENDGSAFIFRGSSYWKFLHPGSAAEDGYPRPLAIDWLDCPQSSSPADISLISRVGRQGFHKDSEQRLVQQMGHTEEADPGQRDCACLNKAENNNGLNLLLLFLMLITMIC